MKKAISIVVLTILLLAAMFSVVPAMTPREYANYQAGLIEEPANESETAISQADQEGGEGEGSSTGLLVVILVLVVIIIAAIFIKIRRQSIKQ